MKAPSKEVAPRRETPLMLRDTPAGKAAVWTGRKWWQHRIRLMPLSVAAVGVVAGGALGALHTTHPEVAGFVDASGIAVAGAFAVGHYALRRRQGRALNGKQIGYVAACGMFLAGFEINATLGDAYTPTSIATYGAATGIATVCWWLRGLVAAETVEPQEAEEPEPPEPDDEEEVTADKIWASRIAAPGGVLAGSALTNVTELVDTHGAPNGVSAVLDLNPGNKVITLKSSDVGTRMEQISEAFDLPPANIAIIPRSGGKLDLKIFDRHPLMRLIRLPKHFNSDSQWVQPVGLTITDEWVPHQLFDPDYGTYHGTFIGSTGSGKSETICTVMDAESRIVTTGGDPLVAHVLLDPHGGVSFPGWNERADLVAHDYDEIVAVIDMLNKIKQKRLDAMVRYKWKVWQPSPEDPIISVKFDEFATVADKRPRLIPATKEAVGEWRKVGMAMAVGVRYPGAQNFGGDMDLRDGLMGYTWLGRTGNRFSGMIASAGRTVGDPALIPTHFADGKTTGGLGFWLGSIADACVMMRSALSNPDDLIGRRFGRTGLTTFDVAEVLRETAAKLAVVAEVIRPPVPTPDSATRWDKIELFLTELGEEANTTQICKGIGEDPEKKLGAVSQECSRAVEQKKLLKTDRGVWILPQHAPLAGVGS